MKYSLVQVVNEKDGFVDGVWLQDHIGTIESAKKIAQDTEKVNGFRIKVAVVEDLGFPTSNYNIMKNLKRLDDKGLASFEKMVNSAKSRSKKQITIDSQVRQSEQLETYSDRQIDARGK